MEDKVIYWITQFWSFLGVVVGVYLGGEAAKRAASALGYDKLPEEKRPFMYRLWYTTISWHPFLVGSLCGLIPGIPVAAWVPDSWASKMLWFGIAGGVSGQLYEALRRTWRGVPTLLKTALSKKLGVEPPPDSLPPEDGGDKP